MAATGTGAVFFLGTRAHYQVLEQPNYDAENGNTSTETLYQNTSVEELWPNDQTLHNTQYNVSYNEDRVNWNYEPNECTIPFDNDQPELSNCIKRRIKRRSSEALLCDDIKPALLNKIDASEQPKEKPSRRISVLSFFTSLARRKRRLESEQVQYLQHLESVLTSCTYRESCRCLDCQSRYFDCAEESDDYSSEDDYSPSFCINDAENLNVEDPDDEVFIDSNPESDNKSTDLLLDEKPAVPEEQETSVTDPQLQLEVAASTSAMLNLLLYHPFSCVVQ